MGNYLLTKWIQDYFVSIALLCVLFAQTSFAATCSDSESLKTLTEQGDYRSALQELDNCLGIQEQISDQDINSFNELVKKVLTHQTTTSLEESYRNFQSVLKTHLLKSLGFEFADYFKTHPKEDAKLFAEIRKADESYYFYYDTGRVLAHSRGIALTDQALMWKNLTGEPQRLGFDDIQNMTLVYELGLSLTGWKLRINNNEQYDIRLSAIPDNVIQPLVSAIIYFINANKTTPEQSIIKLEVPDKEVAILAGWVTLCSEKLASQNDPLKELQALDACLRDYGDDFKLSQTDNELLHKLTEQILTSTNLSLEEGYDNFKTVLSFYFFRDLKLNFQADFDKQRQVELFKEANEAGDIYYFYFDTGKVAADSRGIALTNQALIWKNLLGTSVNWKNLTGSATQIPFTKISSVSLIHEIGLSSSITGWKLRLNDDENSDIALSQLSEENVELFAQALIYFINLAANTQLTLQIPQATQEVLTKTFLERHPQIKSVTDSVFGIFMPKPESTAPDVPKTVDKEMETTPSETDSVPESSNTPETSPVDEEESITDAEAASTEITSSTGEEAVEADMTETTSSTEEEVVETEEPAVSE